MRDLEITSLSAIEHLITHKPDRVSVLFLSGANPRVKAIEAAARKAKIRIDASGGEPRARIAPFRYAELPQFLETMAKKKRSLVIALDHLQDPQNFGALCRSAEGLGLDGVLLPKDRSVSVGPGVYHASVGAVETIPVVSVSNLGEGLRKMKDAGYWILGTTLGEKATPPSEVPDFEKAVLVLGAELEGLSPGIEKICDWQIQIPLRGRVQSLNVSAAGAILMYEFAKRLR